MFRQMPKSESKHFVTRLSSSKVMRRNDEPNLDQTKGLALECLQDWIVADRSVDLFMYQLNDYVRAL